MIQRTTDDPTPIRRHPAAVLVEVQGYACTVVEASTEIVDALDAIEDIDARSDAYAHRAVRRLLRAARTEMSDAERRDEARLAAADILESQRLDDLETEHCQAIRGLNGEVGSSSRQIVSVVQVQNGGRS